MQLIFERGDREAPVGHALVYFRGQDGSILATYVSVPPIEFDITKYVPGFLAGAMEGMDLGGLKGVTAIPPVPEEVSDVEWLHRLAEQRQDDLVFAGGTMHEPMRLASEAAEAARLYAELYEQVSVPAAAGIQASTVDVDSAHFAEMSEQEKLNELTVLTGRLRDSVSAGDPDPDLERQLQALAGQMPAKYRVESLIEAAHVPGERGQKLADLYLQRSYKLFHEDYLDLERIDREIEAISG
jgi:hypothetical protein